MKYLLAFLMCATLVAGIAAAQDTAQPAPVVAAGSTEGLAEWDKIYSVFSHPRCADCHVSDDHPRWSGAHYGGVRVHAFNVQRGTDDSGFGNPGLRCTTCHMDQNSEVLHGPPGAEGWHMAPVEMVWFGQTSAQICAQIKDPARNGDRTLAEVADHVLNDKLVAWGWAPGLGREPAPLSAKETSDAIQRWIDTGSPCPAN